jgi:hypothetical protein
VAPPVKSSLLFIKHAPQLPAVPLQFLMQHAFFYPVENLIHDLRRTDISL